jgi:hypothetical protein
VGGGGKKERKKKWGGGGGVLWEKSGGEKKEKKKLKGNKQNWFYLFVHFCLMLLFDAKCRIVKICLEEVYDIFYHKWFVYISIAYTIHNCLYLFITLFKFYKSM